MNVTIKKKVISVLAFASILSGQTVAKDYQVQKVEKKIMVLVPETGVEAYFSAPSLDLFCSRRESFLNRYINDYEQNGCSERNVHNEIICNLIEKGITRNSSGINAFGTDLQSEVGITLERQQLTLSADFEDKLAKDYGVKRSDVVVLNDVAKYEVANIEVKSRVDGIFSQAIALGNIDYGILPVIGANLKSKLRISTSERYLACALRNGEVELVAQAKGEAKVEDKIEAELLGKLFAIYQQLEKDWAEIKQGGDDQNVGLVLIQLGARMNEIERQLKKDPVLAKEEMLRMEKWLNYFFVQKLDSQSGLNVSLREFSALKDLEQRVYPPRVLDYEFDMTFPVILGGR